MANAKFSRSATLEALADLRARFRFDRFALRSEVSLSNGPWVPLSDEILRRLWADCEGQMGVLPPFGAFADIVQDLAARNGFDPLFDWLKLLRWDGEQRLSGMLSNYFGAAPTPLNEAIGRATLIGGIRRARHPGAKADAMLVLEGRQGLLKSTAVAALSPRPEWFADALDLAAGSREVIEQTQGKFIVEAADLGGLGKADVQRLKALLSRQVDRARPAYARLPVEVPRRFIVIGTVNPGGAGYLADSTGGRRFWPVEVGAIDLDAIRRDRDQLWAEAAEAEAAGEPNWLAPHLDAAAAEEVESRTVGNPWAEGLAKPLAAVTAISTGEALSILGVPMERRGRAAEMQAADALRALGFVPLPKRKGEARKWGRMA